MKLSTGVSKLDELLEGGLPQGNIILLEGDAGSGKEVLAYHFIKSQLDKDKKVGYVFVNETCSEVLSKFKFYGLDVTDYFNSRSFACIDAEGLSDNQKVISCNINELYTVSHTLKDQLQSQSFGEEGNALVVNIVSPALMLHDIKTVYKFLFELFKTIKIKGVTTLVLIDNNMHASKDIAAIEELSDGVLILKSQENGGIKSREVYVKRMEGIKESGKHHAYWVDDKGFEMV